MSTPTNIGFKRLMNKKYPIEGGYVRQFIICMRCRTRAFYDYVPYSLSNPITTTPCGHFFKEYMPLRNNMKYKK